jgi:hypothetical protein
MSNDSYRSALIAMPTAAQLGGDQPLPFVRFPFFPTSPWYSTNPNVGYQTRFYSCGIASSDADFQVGSEVTRPVQFDLPCRVIAINGSCVDEGDVSRFTEQNMNLAYLFRVEYSTGDKLHVFPRLAATVVGTMRNPGEIGGHGYNIDQGASVQLGITPLIADLRIDITLVCLEMRGPRNFSVQGRM